MKNNSSLIYGINSIKEAIKTNENFYKVWISNEINSNTQKDFLIIYLLALFGVNFTLSVHSYMFGFLTIGIGVCMLKHFDQKDES